jgi:hypothetical protein
MSFSLFHLILTIRPVNSLLTFFTWQRNEAKSNRDYWISTEAQARAFDISEVEDHEKALERLFAVLSNKRVLKNRFFRISVWGIRMVFITLVILELYTAIALK